jgi:hypothetical protein
LFENRAKKSANAIAWPNRFIPSFSMPGGGRAEQARALAEQMNDAASREMMLGIAKDYERLAERAEQRAREERKKKES